MATREYFPLIEGDANLPFQKPQSRRLGPARLLLRSGINNAVLIGWGIWAMFSLLSFVQEGINDDLLVAYFLYLVLGGVGLWITRMDILAPMGAFILVAFSGFGLNIPLIATGHIPFIRIDGATLTKVTYVVLCAHLGFMCGALLPNTRFNPVRRIIGTAYSTRETSIALYLGLLVFLIVAAGIRSYFHLGEAGIQPAIPYAGVFQYLLYQGPLVMCVWFLAQGLSQKRIHALLGLSLLVGLAVTQALLGWRGGILYVLIIAAVPFWYQFKRNDGQDHYSMGWLMILILLSWSIIQLGSVVRTERLGGELVFTKGKEEFITNVFLRAQGTTRLAEVVNHFGPLSLTNNFLIEKLLSRHMSATVYIDRVVYGVKPTQSHSVGTSGPGGPYTALGLLGVLGSYFLIGAVYRWSYFGMTDYSTSRVNVLGVVLYAFLIFMLFEILNENLGTNALKMYFAILAEIYAFKFALERSRSTSHLV